MSQRDLVAELRAARVEAPPEVRHRVRLIAAAAPVPPRRITWRRALVVAIPLAAAVAATVVVTRPSHQPSATDEAVQSAQAHTPALAVPQNGAAAKAFSVPSSTTRVQVYGATLGLRVEKAGDVSDGVKRALRIAASLGGYAVSVHASTEGSRSVANLKLKVPRAHVQEALTRMSQLGTITEENVSTLDKQAGLNATDRLIARLQKQLAALRKQPSTPQTEQSIAALTARIAKLQRGEAATRRAAHYATISLHIATAPVTVATKHGHGPLHGVVVALTWLGIGAIYALAVGLPVGLLLGLGWLVLRLVRRRRVDALLDRS